MDIVSKLGGYKGAFEPIVMYFFPIVILHFLINYSAVIRRIYNSIYKKELERTLRATFDRVKLVPNLELKLQLNDKQDKYDALKK
jgi:hypothetical protein